jgi:putative adhesin
MKPLRWGALSVLALLTAVSAAPAHDWDSVKGSFDRTLTVTGPVDLEVRTGTGDIKVHAGPSRQVTIHGKIQARNDGASAEEKAKYFENHPPIDQDANHIRIGRVEDHEMTRNVSIDYEIEVPAETSLTTETGSGDVTVEGLHGSARLESGSGDMTVASLQGDLRVRTGSGDGRIHNVSGGRIEITTGSGDFEVRGVEGALELRTGSGDVRAEGKPTGEWRVETGSGQIHVRVPSDLAFELDAHTSSGEISTDLPVTVTGTVGHGSVRGKVRGGGVLVELRAGSGDIEVN